MLFGNPGEFITLILFFNYFSMNALKNRFSAHIILLLVASAPLLHSQQSDSPSLVLLSLSAHPDDEGGATLAYYGMLKGVKTYSLFFTRGEGGQNEIGSELYEDLGAIRTKETLEAATIIGSETYFLGFPDFGYSKTAKESFVMWGGKDSVIARLVYYIRALQPDVIITNHDTLTTKPNRQHGNHQAVGISAYEAFEKASDPSYHPEQLREVITPWQVKKLFVRYHDRDTALIIQPPVTTDVTRKDALGNTIFDISLSALRKHRSQGMLRPSRQHRYYLLRENRKYLFDNADLFSGIGPTMKETVPIPELKLVPPPPTDTFKDITKTRAKHSEGINVGLIKTYDDTIEKILKAFNIRHTILDSSQLSTRDVAEYTVILLDLRTYQYRPDVLGNNRKLLDYAGQGGNIITFYHKQDDWIGKNVSPYPIGLTRDRVTEEDAAVRLLLPDHPLLSSPNRITVHDWSGWIQERSIYLPSDDTAKTSARYQRLLAMSDTDEQQPPTSLIWAPYGRGTYTYCSLVLYRQLRLGNEGAMKLFFNMISQPRQ